MAVVAVCNAQGVLCARYCTLFPVVKVTLNAVFGTGKSTGRLSREDAHGNEGNVAFALVLAQKLAFGLSFHCVCLPVDIMAQEHVFWNGYTFSGDKRHD